jgi:hypothetical protein
LPWIVAVFCVLLIGAVAVGVLAQRTPTSDTTYQPGDLLTISDGSFTMTLPDGWVDQTQEYRDWYADTNDGAESAIEAMVSVDGLPILETHNFVSISGHPLLGITASGSTQLEDALNDWRLRFDDVTSLASDQFATNAGDVVWYGGVNGHMSGVEKSIIVAVVMGQDTFAQFDLEVRPPYYSAEADLLEALKSLVFTPITGTVEAVSWWQPHTDGRTYSSDGQASILVPETWTHLIYAADEDAVDPRIDFDFLGLWQIGQGEGQDAATVSLVVGPPPLAGLNALEQLEAQYGAVAETTTDENGVQYTVDSLGSFSAPGALDAAKVALTADYDVTGIAFFEGRIVPRHCYVLMSSTLEAMVCVEALDDEIDSAVKSVEGVLGTLRFETTAS